MKTRFIRTVAVAVGTAAVVALAGCSSQPSSAADEEPISTLRVGMVALGQLPVDQAISQGYFTGPLEDAEIEYVSYPSGAAAIPALVAGDIDVVYTNNVSAGLAIAQNFDLKLITTADSIKANNQQVVVQADGPVSSLDDLAGETVSVNALQSLGWLGFQVALVDAGIDPKDVTFTEVAFPEAASVMGRGEIVAAQMPQPFAEAAVSSGDAVQLFDFNDFDELSSLPIGNFYTTGDWAKAHPEAVRSFDAGVNKALADLAGDVDLVTQLTMAAAGSPEESARIIAEAIEYIPNRDAAETQRVFDLMLEYDMISAPIDINTILIKQ